MAIFAVYVYFSILIDQFCKCGDAELQLVARRRGVIGSRNPHIHGNAEGVVKPRIFQRDICRYTLLFQDFRKTEGTALVSSSIYAIGNVIVVERPTRCVLVIHECLERNIERKRPAGRKNIQRERGTEKRHVLKKHLHLHHFHIWVAHFPERMHYRRDDDEKRGNSEKRD